MKGISHIHSHTHKKKLKNPTLGSNIKHFAHDVTRFRCKDSDYKLPGSATLNLRSICHTRVIPFIIDYRRQRSGSPEPGGKAREPQIGTVWRHHSARWGDCICRLSAVWEVPIGNIPKLSFKWQCRKIKEAE